MKKNHKKLLTFLLNGDRIVESKRQNGSIFYWFYKSKKNIPYQTFQYLKSFLIETSDKLNSYSIGEYILGEEMYKQLERERKAKEEAKAIKLAALKKPKPKLPEIKLSEFLARHNLKDCSRLFEMGVIELNFDKVRNPNILVNEKDKITVNNRILEWNKI